MTYLATWTYLRHILQPVAQYLLIFCWQGAVSTSLTAGDVEGMIASRIGRVIPGFHDECVCDSSVHSELGNEGPI